MNAQTKNQLPFYEIPAAPENYSSGNVVTRMIDGLGYRYYWASDSLKESDLAFQPSESGKSCLETIQHIYDLSVTIKNVANSAANVRKNSKNEMSYEEMRKKTLENLFEARSSFLNKTDAEIEPLKVIFQNGENKSEFPFWNFINGPLSDAIYHTGQIVVFRRASGHPISSNVRVFTGVNAK